jgi:hypothetical protein
MSELLLPGEYVPQEQDKKEVERVRRVIADVYTFVRSQEINRTIGSFTFDHYIEQAKTLIKGDSRSIRDASGQAIDSRPTKLEVVTILENEFRQTLQQARALASKVDEKDRESP